MTTESAIRKSLLVIVTSDPRSSHRPAEAVRIAAGVAAWRKVVVSLYLAGPAVLALSSDVDDFINEESFTHFLPMIPETDGAILAEAGAPLLSSIIEPPVPFQTIDRAELAARGSRTNYLLTF